MSTYRTPFGIREPGTTAGETLVGSSADTAIGATDLFRDGEYLQSIAFLESFRGGIAEVCRRLSENVTDASFALYGFAVKAIRGLRRAPLPVPKEALGQQKVGTLRDLGVFDTHLGMAIAARAKIAQEARAVLGGKTFEIVKNNGQTFLKDGDGVLPDPLSEKEKLVAMSAAVPSKYRGKLESAQSACAAIRAKLPEECEDNVKLIRSGPLQDKCIEAVNQKGQVLRLIEVQPGRFVAYLSSQEHPNRFWARFGMLKEKRKI